MYIPASFAEDDVDKLHDLVEGHSFGLLVSTEDGVPAASHLPFLLERDVGDFGCLIGHMAKANAQWKAAADQQVLVILIGPHCYISPAWYKADNVVPTWNYVAVHVYGTLRLDDSRERRLEIVRRTVEENEKNREMPWLLDDVDEKFVDGLLDAIVGFRIDIDRIEGKWKLNQNQNPERRSNVVQALTAAGGDACLQIASLISEGLEE